MSETAESFDEQLRRAFKLQPSFVVMKLGATGKGVVMAVRKTVEGAHTAAAECCRVEVDGYHDFEIRELPYGCNDGGTAIGRYESDVSGRGWIGYSRSEPRQHAYHWKPGAKR